MDEYPILPGYEMVEVRIYLGDKKLEVKQGVLEEVLTNPDQTRWVLEGLIAKVKAELITEGIISGRP